MYANSAAREETACLTGYCTGYSTWITEAFFLFSSWISATENPHTQGSVALRSCKLVKFFIQNLTGECVYLIEVTAYSTAVKLRTNIAQDFLRETLKETQQRWTADTCQLSCPPGCWRRFEFQRVSSVKVTSHLFKKQFCTVKKASQNYLWQSPVHGLVSPGPCTVAVPAGNGTAAFRAWRQQHPIPCPARIGCHPSAPSPAHFYFTLLSDTKLGLGFSSSWSAWES